MMAELEKCILNLYDIGAIKFGDYVLKSGLHSPIYFDLRILVSYPSLLETISKLMCEHVTKEYDIFCGVPYAALPFAVLMSVNKNIPMIMRRKEKKSHGTMQIFEGKFQKGQSCLVIEDVMVSGSSIVETVDLLRAENLEVTDALVFLDREQGGEQNAKTKRNVIIKSVVTATKVFEVLSKHDLIDKKTLTKIGKFFDDNRICPLLEEASKLKMRTLDVVHPVTKMLMDIVMLKKSNLCVAADVKTSEELLQLAEEVGSCICMLKTHIDMLSDFTFETVEKLKELAKKHNFLLFEDRKFGDIGNTVNMQYTEGVYKISQWADVVTVHGVPGSGVIKGLTSGLTDDQLRGIVIVAEMSSEGTLTNQDYIKGCLKMAEESSRVMGFVSQSRVGRSSKFLQMAPGVSIASSADSLGQKYVTPEEAVEKRGADIVIVGRGITAGTDVKGAAHEFQKRSFAAFEKNVKWN